MLSDGDRVEEMKGEGGWGVSLSEKLPAATLGRWGDWLRAHRVQSNLPAPGRGAISQFAHLGLDTLGLKFTCECVAAGQFHHHICSLCAIEAERIVKHVLGADDKRTTLEVHVAYRTRHPK